MTAAIVLTAFAAAAPSHFIALGAGRNWVIIEPARNQVEPLQLPSGFVPEDLTIAPDGELVAFTAQITPVRTERLFIWARRGHAAPASIGGAAGYHADPVFSPDGAWIYFAHHPQGHGRPSAHDARAFAQIYRVRPDGSELQPLTSGSGCHYAPALSADNQLLFVHSPCHGRRRAVAGMPAGGGAQRALATVESAMDELTVVPGGDRALFSVTGLDTLTVSELDLKTGRTAPLFTYRRQGARARPRFGAGAEQIYYLRGRRVLLREGSREREIALLPGTQ